MEIELNQDEIPEFLRGSQLYKNFDFTDDDTTKIPIKYYKSDTNVKTFEDLINLLHVNRFWMVENTQFEIYDFVLNNKKKGKKFPSSRKKDYEQFSNMKAYEENAILTGACNYQLNDDEKNYKGERYEIKSNPGQMINYAIRKGHLNLLKYFYKNKEKYPWNRSSSFWAIKNLQFDIFMYLMETECSLHDGCFVLACQTKDPRFLSYLLENHQDRFLKSVLQIGSELVFHAKNERYFFIKYAVECNLIENVKLLRNHGFELNLEILELIVSCGYLELLQFAYDDGCSLSDGLCITAVSFNKFEILKYLYQNGCLLSVPVSIEAVKNGKLEILEYLYENKCPWNENTCAKAASVGDLEILKYLHENGCPWNERTTEFASENSNIECLKYAHQNGCPIHDRIFLESLINEDLIIFKYATENNFPFDNNSMTMDSFEQFTDDILVEGNFDFTRYLIEHGYTYLKYSLWLCCYSAKEKNNQDFLDFALPICSKDSSMCDESAANGEIEFLKFLIANGCDIDNKSIMINAASNHETDCLKYLHKMNIPWNVETINSAVENHSIQNLEYLHENGCPWDKTSIFRAIENHSYYCLKYLLKNECPSSDILDYSIKMADLECFKILSSYNIFSPWGKEIIYSCIKDNNNMLLDFMIDLKQIDKVTGKDMIETARKVKNIEAILILVSKGFEISKKIEKYVSKQIDEWPRFSALVNLLKGNNYEAKRRIEKLFPGIYFENIKAVMDDSDSDSEFPLDDYPGF